jgi:hypothetical protein
MTKNLPRMNGLGDVVEAVTEATGIKKAVETVAKATGRDCGCGRRKEALNRLVPFKKEDADVVQPDEA